MFVSPRLFNWRAVEFWHDPYPVGLIKPIMADELYNELVRAYPDEKVFAHMKGAYNKYSLSEVNNKDAYKSFIKSSPLWTAFHSYIKDPSFIDEAFEVLRSQNVVLERLPDFKYRARFEFSSIPADGGFIWPHTDIPSKIITLVVSMQNGTWDPTYGGGTDILEPNKPGKYIDYKVPLSEFNIIRTFEYQPNQCVFFVKTNNSWHSVGPFTGPADGPMRRTLTINIEKFKI